MSPAATARQATTVTSTRRCPRIRIVHLLRYSPAARAGLVASMTFRSPIPTALAAYSRSMHAMGSWLARNRSVPAFSKSRLRPICLRPVLWFSSLLGLSVPLTALWNLEALDYAYCHDPATVRCNSSIPQGAAGFSRAASAACSSFCIEPIVASESPVNWPLTLSIISAATPGRLMLKYMSASSRQAMTRT